MWGRGTLCDLKTCTVDIGMSVCNVIYLKKKKNAKVRDTFNLKQKEYIGKFECRNE